MTALAVSLRTLIQSVINAAKSGMAVTDFTLQAIDFPPAVNINDLPTAGLVSIIDMAPDVDVLTRNRVTQRTIPVQIAVQKKVTATDTTTIGKYKELVDDLQQAIIKGEYAGYSFTRAEALKDESGFPFSYVGLREHGVFEAYFTAFFHCLIE